MAAGVPARSSRAAQLGSAGVSYALVAVLERLERVKESGTGYVARCPAHDDHHPSLSITEGRDGRVLLKCHAAKGCDVDSITKALGMTTADLFPKNDIGSSRAHESLGDIADTYDYVDEDGALLYQVARYVPKTFRPRRKVNGAWVYGLNGVRRILYRLPELLAAVAVGETIYITEGEKDALAIVEAGGVATCNSGGAGKWRAEFSAYFAGAGVIIVADKDGPGRLHAAAVESLLKGVARSVRIVEARVGKDAADHLAAGYSLEEFVSVERPAPDSAEVNPIRAAFVTAPELAASEDESVDWVLEDYIAPSSTTQLSGAPKLAGKTTFALCLADAVARGETFMGRATKKGIVVYLSEQTSKSFKASARGTGVLENPDVHVLLRSRVWGYDWETIISEATAYCHEVGAVLLIVDTLGRWASLMGDAENDAGAALAVMQPLEEAAAGLAVLVIRHDRKDAGANIVDAGRGSSAYAGAFDQLLSLKRVGGSGHENRRKLGSEGRFAETPRELQIEYAGGTFLDRGTEAGVESAEVRATLLAILPGGEDEARTRDHLLDACGGPAREATLVRVLGTEGDPEKGKPPSGLVGEGLVLRRKGAGAASARAYGYWLAPDAAGCEPLEMSDES